MDILAVMSARFLMLTSREQEVLGLSERAALLRYTGLSEEELVWHRLEREPFPEIDLADWDGIILCGSRWDAGAPEETKSQRQRDVEAALDKFYGRIVPADFPFMGLCYGLGTLCQHLGGTITDRYGEEISAPTFTLTPAGRADPMLEGVTERFRAYVGHHEAVGTLPPGMEVLVGGEQAPIQMTRTGTNLYATQFHPELDLDGINLRIEVFADAGYYLPSERPVVEARVLGVDTSAAHRILRNFADRYRESRHTR